MSSSKNWDFRIDAGVYKELKKIPEPTARRLIEIIEALPENPYAGDITKIRGEQFLWRRRVGEYRIFFEIHQNNHLIDVVRLKRRGSKTY